MGPFASIVATPATLFLLAVGIASLFVIWLSEAKAKAIAFLFLCVAATGLLFLYVPDFRSGLISSFSLPINPEKLAWGIEQGSQNLLLGTNAMMIAAIVGAGFGLVAAATGSRKLGALMTSISTLYILAAICGFFGPIVFSLG
jgi:hypothetical protein